MILNLTPGATEDSDWIKLEEFGKGCHSYATLSYCWGGRQETSTTSSSIEQHKCGIHVSTLPLTLQHAVAVTRGLAIQYLWIDSLCTIQDSGASLNQELGKMAGIYASSELTIIASTASTCHEGFLSNNISPILPKWPYRCQNGKIGTVYLSRIIVPNHPLLGPQPADHRAWIFQEQFLSTRVLEFREGGYAFTCSESEFIARPNPSHHVDSSKRSINGLRNAEGFNRIVELHRLRESFVPSQSFPFLWEEVLSKYSTRAMTNEMDKLPALSSIASLYAKITGDRYIAGLWQLQLPRLLLWRRPYFKFDQPNEWRAPSWSPLCVDGPIFYGLPWEPPISEDLLGTEAIIRERRKQETEITLAMFSFIDASVSLKSTVVPYGCITDAALTVKGKLICYQRIPESSWDPSTWGCSDFKIGRLGVERWDVLLPSKDSDVQNAGDDNENSGV